MSAFTPARDGLAEVRFHLDLYSRTNVRNSAAVFLSQCHEECFCYHCLDHRRLAILPYPEELEGKLPHQNPEGCPRWVQAHPYTSY
jgi:hypothetical protein